MNEYLLMLANSLCFVGIMSFVITTIFFTLGKFVEKQIVINNIDYLITDTMGSFPSIIKPELKQSIKDSIINLMKVMKKLLRILMKWFN